MNGNGQWWRATPNDHDPRQTPLRPQQPDTQLQALMEAPPHAVPTKPLSDSLPARERISDALDQLPARRREIFEALVIERKTQAEVAAETGLSRTTIQRERVRAARQLAALLDGELDAR